MTTSNQDDRAGNAGDTGTNVTTPLGGGMGSITITVPGCVQIGAPNQPIGPAQVAVPAGSGMPFFGNVVPDGWLLCNGAEISREDYAALFAAIGTTYGVGNGNTTFQLPDLRGRFPLGLDNMGGTSADVVTATEADGLGGASGDESVALASNHIPSHEHVFAGGYDSSAGTNPYENIRTTSRWHHVIDQSNFHSTPYVRYYGWVDNGIESYDPPGESTQYPFITGGGPGDAHPNMPPYLSLNYIIKT